MKVSKHLLAVIAMAGTMGFSAVASAMDFSVYGSLRGGLNQVDTDDSQAAKSSAFTVASPYVVALAGATTVAEAEAVGVNAEMLAFFDPSADGVAITDAEVNALTAATIFAAFDNVAVTGTAIGDGLTGIDANLLAGEGVEGEADDAQLELGHGFAGSRIGIRGSEDLGNGAEAGLHWEVNVGGAGETAGGRHANVWYSGAFGKVTIGQQGNPYRNAANWDQSWWIGGQNRPDRNFGGDGGSRLQGVRYDGEAGAFNFSVMATAQNDDSNAALARDVGIVAEGNGVVANDADAAYAAGTVSYDEVESETGIDSLIATGHYDMGVATINLGYRTDNNEAQAVGQAFDNFVISANGTLDALDWYIAFESNTDNTNVTSSVELIGDSDATAGNGLHADDVTANENLETVVDALSTAHDSTTIGLFLGYHLSDVSTIYLEWEDTANDGLDLNGDNLDRNTTLLGFSRNIGPNTSFIAEYVTIDNGSEFDADSTRLLGFLKVDF